MFLSIFSRIGIMFVVLLVGAAARARGMLTKESTDGLGRLAIEVTLPFLYFSTLATSLNRELFLSIWPLPLFAIALTLFAYLISRLVAFQLKLKLNERGTFIFLGAFANYGFLAIPLVFALFGEEGLVRVVVFNLGITFLYWTFGIAILSAPRVKGLKLLKNLFNNATIALLLGVTAGITAFPIPQFVLEVTKLIGGATIPLALIVVGSILAHPTAQKTPWRTILSLAACRLMLIPGLVLLLVNFLSLPKMLAAIIVLQAALPSASTTPMLTRKFEANAELAASGVFFTTLFSLFTVPLFLSLVLR